MKIKFIEFPKEIVMIYNKKKDELIVNSKVIKPSSEEVLRKYKFIFEDGKIKVKNKNQRGNKNDN